MTSRQGVKGLFGTVFRQTEVDRKVDLLQPQPPQGGGSLPIRDIPDGGSFGLDGQWVEGACCQSWCPELHTQDCGEQRQPQVSKVQLCAVHMGTTMARVCLNPVGVTKASRVICVWLSIV